MRGGLSCADVEASAARASKENVGDEMVHAPDVVPQIEMCSVVVVRDVDIAHRANIRRLPRKEKMGENAAAVLETKCRTVDMDPLKDRVSGGI